MKLEITDRNDAETLIRSLINEKKWVVDAYQTKENGPFIVRWFEHKEYTAQDGKKFHDEIWRTKNGEIHLIQDLEPEHVRNILRMILRQEREQTELIKRLSEKLKTESDSDPLFENDDEPFSPYHLPGSTTLQ